MLGIGKDVSGFALAQAPFGRSGEGSDVIDFLKRKKEIKQEHDRIINEIRMRATDELLELETSSRLKNIDPDSIHKIGDRFLSGTTSGPTAERHGVGRVHLRIKKYYKVDDDGAVHYLVEQTFPDGAKGEVRLTDENLVHAEKQGALRLVDM
jgi:hypothetical protein